jgi:hypothetical protein
MVDAVAENVPRALAAPVKSDRCRTPTGSGVSVDVSVGDAVTVPEGVVVELPVLVEDTDTVCRTTVARTAGKSQQTLTHAHKFAIN